MNGLDGALVLLGATGTRRDRWKEQGHTRGPLAPELQSRQWYRLDPSCPGWRVGLLWQCGGLEYIEGWL